MTGTVHTQDPVYSRLTFALLEDSGWYQPDYELAEDLAWGKNLGCDFALLSCMQLMEMNVIAGEPKYPFCNTLTKRSSKTSCTADRKAVGSCNLAMFNSRVPRQYQNFDSVDGVSNKRDVDKVLISYVEAHDHDHHCC